METGLAIFVDRGTRQALHHATSLAMTALAAGERVVVALFHEGLAGWARAFDGGADDFGAGPDAERLRLGFARLNVPPLPRYLDDLRAVGAARIEVVACGAAVELLGLDVDALIESGAVDDVVGLPTLWRRVRGWRIVTAG